MCGIAGFFNYKTKVPVEHRRLQEALTAMRYRGPDHMGFYLNGDIALGNVRLAIQDLSSAGNQPVYNEDKTIVAVYNGEIYNYPCLRKELEDKGHVFRSHTDTEVLVHAYEEFGPAMADQFNGMFTFAVFDSKKRTLVLGRDRSGQKPLFLHRNRHGIFFSSELAAMLPHLDGLSLNEMSVRNFLSLGYTLEPQTILNETATLEPGMLVVFSYQGERLKRFWPKQAYNEHKYGNLKEWEQEADRVFKNAVKRHLLSDVPLALFLSGGIDSSLLALYLKEERKISKAFTGSFEGFEDHDEYDVARKFADFCGFQVEKVVLSNSVLAGNLEDFLERSSQPQGDYSGLASFSLAKEVSKEYKVVLGGDGGDELFGGYPTYVLPYLAGHYGFIPKNFISLARRFLSLFCDRRKYMSYPFQLQQMSLAWGCDTALAHFMIKNFLPQQLSAGLLKYGPVENEYAAEKVINDFYENAFSHPVNKLCWVDFNTFLRSATIPKAERNTMLFSLELRLPFLDNEVMDLGFSTDANLKIRGVETKVALKYLLKSKISGKVDLIPIKHGFSPPLVALFKKELKDWKEDSLKMKSPFLRPEACRILEEWQKNGWDLHRLEWNICVLNDWCHRNRIT